MIIGALHAESLSGNPGAPRMGVSTAPSRGRRSPAPTLDTSRKPSSASSMSSGVPTPRNTKAGWLRKSHKGGAMDDDASDRYFVCIGFHVSYYTDPSRSAGKARPTARHARKSSSHTAAKLPSPSSSPRGPPPRPLSRRRPPAHRRTRTGRFDLREVVSFARSADPAAIDGVSLTLQPGGKRSTKQITVSFAPRPNEREEWLRYWASAVPLSALSGELDMHRDDTLVEALSRTYGRQARALPQPRPPRGPRLLAPRRRPRPPPRGSIRTTRARSVGP